MTKDLVARRAMLEARRAMLKTSGFAAAGLLLAWRTPAASAERLNVKDPEAAALGYVENSGQVDVKKYPTYIKGSNCENCLQLQGTPGNNYRPCSLFPGKLVSVSGWCSGWAAEM
jgi:hypothetical protein